ncbi:hypothetical protein CKO28_01415 [Rhodovibrio sodomensis]|uniref:Uncharacterized protein n=1 Tax=Rhodovibrio sodomensis TaxID=1088 RepID=A0ABS1D8E7_9PROT|nr:hypothetical protein [Rhodovibrio sodomensis]MBK1666703.1 hypothetical protein [Rhodovibrio sodomensis]
MQQPRRLHDYPLTHPRILTREQLERRRAERRTHLGKRLREQRSRRLGELLSFFRKPTRPGIKG